MFLLVVFTVCGLFIYTYFNREIIISRVSETLNRQLKGSLVTKHISIDFFHYFPAASVQFTEVSIRDSLFEKHKMDLLRASDLFVKINLKDLFSSGLTLENVTIRQGSLYIFRDSTGYTNSYLLQNNSGNSGNDIPSYLRELILKDFRFVYSDRTRNRFLNIAVTYLKCNLHRQPGEIVFAIESKGKIRQLSFNLEKGAYARDAAFENNFLAYYNTKEKSLHIPEHSFYLGGNFVSASADFRFNAPTSFTADLKSQRISFERALDLVMFRTRNVLSNFRFSRPLRLEVHMEGSLDRGTKPLVNAKLITKGNTLTYRDFHFTKTSLQAFYTNRYDPDSAISESNNEVVISGFTATWLDIPVNVSTTHIRNFPKPYFTTTASGAFPLQVLNNFPDGGLYTFSKGNCRYLVTLTAGNDSVEWHNSVLASIFIENGALIYEPRGLPFQDVNAAITIRDNDVIFDSVSCRSGRSVLSVKGKAPGVFDQLNTDFNATRLDWTINSPAFYLEDFTTFLGTRKKKLRNEKKSKSSQSNFGKHLDRYLSACSLNMNMKIGSITAGNFTATSLSGNVKMNNDILTLTKIKLDHADGHVALSGKLTPLPGEMQAVSVQSKLKAVDISKVFLAFDNFSQQTLTSSQIDGLVDANVTLNLTMDRNAVISQSSIVGSVDLSIREGELKGFQPMGKLSKFLFRNRDFSNIRFSELTNSFVARGKDIYFDRMKINSSVLELYVEGNYSLDGTADLQIQIPVSNLKKRDWEELSDNITDKGEKGMNVFIHAKTDETGEIRFRYDPLKKIKEKRAKR